MQYNRLARSSIGLCAKVFAALIIASGCAEPITESERARMPGRVVPRKPPVQNPVSDDDKPTPALNDDVDDITKLRTPEEKNTYEPPISIARKLVEKAAFHLRGQALQGNLTPEQFKKGSEDVVVDWLKTVHLSDVGNFLSSALDFYTTLTGGSVVDNLSKLSKSVGKAVKTVFKGVKSFFSYWKSDDDEMSEDEKQEIEKAKAQRKEDDRQADEAIKTSGLKNDMASLVSDATIRKTLLTPTDMSDFLRDVRMNFPTEKKWRKAASVTRYDDAGKVTLVYIVQNFLHEAFKSEALAKEFLALELTPDERYQRMRDIILINDDKWPQDKKLRELETYLSLDLLGDDYSDYRNASERERILAQLFADLVGTFKVAATAIFNEATIRADIKGLKQELTLPAEMSQFVDVIFSKKLVDAQPDTYKNAYNQICYLKDFVAAERSEAMGRLIKVAISADEVAKTVAEEAFNLVTGSKTIKSKSLCESVKNLWRKEFSFRHH